MLARMDYRPYREKIEWANYWWDNAFEKRQDRVLLIGDSTARAYRRELSEKIKRPIDFFGTSSVVTDELFIRELEMFMSIKEYSYDIIQVQIGVHGIVSESGRKLPENYYQYYEEAYIDLIKFLNGKCNRLILATITPVIKPFSISNPILYKIYARLHFKGNEIVDERFEEGIRKRNEIIYKAAERYKVSVNDLYKYMNNEGRHFRHIDHVHYEKRAKAFIAARVAEFCENKE